MEFFANSHLSLFIFTRVSLLHNASQRNHLFTIFFKHFMLIPSHLRIRKLKMHPIKFLTPICESIRKVASRYFPLISSDYSTRLKEEIPTRPRISFHYYNNDFFFKSWTRDFIENRSSGYTHEDSVLILVQLFLRGSKCIATVNNMFSLPVKLF